MCKLVELRQLIMDKKFSQALLLSNSIEEYEHDENFWYLKGILHRCLEDYKQSLEYLEKARSISPESKEILLALGISYQLDSQFNKAIDVFRSALDIDDRYLPAINSLALTYKRAEDFEKSLNAYKYALKIISEAIADNIIENPPNDYYPEPPVKEAYWVRMAFQSLVYISCKLDYKAYLVPNKEIERDESENKTHGVSLWVDKDTQESKKAIQFLPNYFNYFFHLLLEDPYYLTVVLNMGLVLEILGEDEEAQVCFREENYFS